MEESSHLSFYYEMLNKLKRLKKKLKQVAVITTVKTTLLDKK